LKKNAANNDTGGFIYIIEKKNSGTNDSGIFICKMEKNGETIVPVFLCYYAIQSVK
jgi:hypothetical protein